MIQILIGGDTKKKGDFVIELTAKRESISVREDNLSKELVMSYCYSVDLFNQSSTVVLENILSSTEISFSLSELDDMKKSDTIYIFKEDKLSKILENKYKKYADIKNFEKKKVTQAPKFNIFSITDAYGSKDKILTWTLYNKSVREGIEGEALAGILFWKIKTMILTGSNAFSKKDLKKQSSEIIALYHKAHKGTCDLTIGLEQFILNSLSVK